MDRIGIKVPSEEEEKRRPPPKTEPGIIITMRVSFPFDVGGWWMGCSGVAIKESVNPSSEEEDASLSGGVSESVQKVRREFGSVPLPSPFKSCLWSINEMFLDFVLLFFLLVFS